MRVYNTRRRNLTRSLKENTDDNSIIYVAVSDDLVDMDEFGNPGTDDGGQKANEILFILWSQFPSIDDAIFEASPAELRDLLDKYDFIDPETDLIIGESFTEDDDGQPVIKDRIHDVYSLLYEQRPLDED